MEVSLEACAQLTVVGVPFGCSALLTSTSAVTRWTSRYAGVWHMREFLLVHWKREELWQVHGRGPRYICTRVNRVFVRPDRHSSQAAVALTITQIPRRVATTLATGLVEVLLDPLAACFNLSEVVVWQSSSLLDLVSRVHGA